MHVRQAVVAAGVTVGQVLVIEPEDVEQGCMEVMYVDPLVGHRDAVLDAREIRKPRFEVRDFRPHDETAVREYAGDAPIDRSLVQKVLLFQIDEFHRRFESITFDDAAETVSNT